MDNLQEKHIPFVRWVEQPENILTCVATAPVLKSSLGDALKKCQLWK